jgi:hypothetical protein
MRRTAVLLLTVGALAVPATALALAPISIHPSTIHAGKVLKVSGHPGDGCTGDHTVTIYSRAFSSEHEFAGVPAVFAKVRDSGSYTKHIRIPSWKHSGDYSVSARCGGALIGSRTLHVVHHQAHHHVRVHGHHSGGSVHGG